VEGVTCGPQKIQDQQRRLAELRYVHLLRISRSAPPFLGLSSCQPSWTGNRIERCLSYDEKPLLLFQKLKDAKKNPVFMLKHIKDIRSPIAVAQQKQAARKASETPSSSQSRGSSADRPSLRPPLLQAQSAILGPNGQQPGHSQPGFLTGGNGKSGWPEATSPAIDNKDKQEDLSSSMLPSTSTTTDPGTHHQESSGPTVNVKEPMPSGSGTLSYAVAIYPYMAEQEDEFDVVVYAS